jgi:signal transduction histidine kinase
MAGDLLDIIAQFGGGRGDQGNEVVRFLLASFFWLILFLTAFRQWRHDREYRDRVIFIAAAIGLLSELLMCGVHFEEWKWYKYHDLLHLFYPPIEHTIQLFVSILIGYAFLRYYSFQEMMPRLYMIAGTAITLALYVGTAPTWFTFLENHPDARFGLFWGDMAFRIFGSLIKGAAVVALIVFRLQKLEVPKTLTVAFVFFFLDDFLMIFNLASGDIYKDIYNPIRHNLHIWAIPLLISVYWRELDVRTRKEEDRLEKMNRCFLSFGSDTDMNIRRLTELCRELLDAYCCCYNRPGGEMLYSMKCADNSKEVSVQSGSSSSICLDLISRGGDEVLVIEDLTTTNYYESDPVVRHKGIVTYLGKPINLGGRTVGALCVSYRSRRQITKADEKILGILAAAVSIEEERRIVGMELEQSEKSLRRLSAHLQSVREEERGAISREIHDELGQILTAFKMDLYWMRKRLDGGHKVLQEKIDRMVESLNAAIKSVQRIIAELRPSILDDLGLIEAVDWQSKEFQAKTGIKSSVSTEGLMDDLPKDITTALFRIYQESLTNVVRHAQATEVCTKIYHDAGNIVAEIRDNGIGIDENKIDNHNSFGLMGMKERAHALGGEVVISSATGGGTVVRAQIPIKRKGENNDQGNDR